MKDDLNDHWHEHPPDEPYWELVTKVMSICILALAALAFLIWLFTPAHGRDLGQWENVDAVTRAWFGKLMQPDTVGQMGGGISCCGESDAYWADEVHVRDGKTYAVITDERDDDPLMRIHENVGTEYEVPPQKVVGAEQRLQGNPTGHTVIFLGTAFWQGETRSKRPVLCYVPNSGV